MSAYFSNGGRRAYYVRIAPADAVAATVDLQSSRAQGANTGDGSTAAVTEAVLTPVTLEGPVIPSSLTFSWRAAGTPVVTEGLMQIDGTTALVGDAAATSFIGRIDPTALPTIDTDHFAVDPGGTLTLAEGGANTITLTQVGATAYASGATGNDIATLDLKTGILHMTWGDNTPTAAPITLTYTPATETLSVTDDGAGVLPAGSVLTGAGAVDYAALTYAFTTVGGSEPHDGAPIRADYEVLAWTAAPISVGAWGNDTRIEVAGNADFYTVATNAFTRFDVNVTQLNSETGSYAVVETFEELVFTDSTSPQYFPDVLNDLSDLVSIDEPASNEEAPQQLNGTDATQDIGAGDGATRNFTGTLAKNALSNRTLTITWTSGATTYTITDDGTGSLAGDVDGAGANTINYTSGAFDVTLSVSYPPDVNTFVTATYSSTPAETSHIEQFGDTTKTYTDGSSVVHFIAGTDGTYDTANYQRDQFTSPALEATYKGMFALNKVDELLQVCIPDFAGDVQITKDMMDYVEGRASQPSGGDRFAILTTPVGSSSQEAVDFVRFDLGQYSKYSAMYWPWVKVADPTRDNRLVNFPPVMHLAGIYARTDTVRNVGKAPGGTVDGALRFLDSLEILPSQGERDHVSPNRINSLISSPQTGLAVWGVRTLSQTSDWRYINVRRLFMFMEKSIFNSTQWIVFENNGPALWARIRAQVQGFLGGLFNDGLFAGNSASEAFFVIVDETNNPQASIDAGQVIIDVGVAPNKPAEFVRFRFQQKTLSE
jgi:phage tail sheath protein FI